MNDIRQIINALDPQDRVMWSKMRTDMRRGYLNAHNSTVGINQWDNNDDAFLDLIDIKLALLFDRSGKMESTTAVVEKKDADYIEQDIIKHAESVTKVLEAARTMPPSNGWDTGIGKVQG